MGNLDIVMPPCLVTEYIATRMGGLDTAYLVTDVTHKRDTHFICMGLAGHY